MSQCFISTRLAFYQDEWCEHEVDAMSICPGSVVCTRNGSGCNVFGLGMVASALPQYQLHSREDAAKGNSCVDETLVALDHGRGVTKTAQGGHKGHTRARPIRARPTRARPIFAWPVRARPIRAWPTGPMGANEGQP